MFHRIFFEDPIGSCAFFSLAMAYLSVWLRRIFWVWGMFFAISAILAKVAGIVTWGCLGLLILIGGLFALLETSIKGWSRLGVITVITMASLGLWWHIVPGFSEWKLVEGVVLNYDRAALGLWALVGTLPLAKTRKDWGQVFRVALPVGVLGGALYGLLGWELGFAEWDPILPHFFVGILFCELFFVLVSEEAFMRGFLQRELDRFLGDRWWGTIGVIGVMTLVFVLLNIGVGGFGAITANGLMGLIYAMLYASTGFVESTIVARFVVRTGLLFLFDGYSPAGG